MWRVVPCGWHPRSPSFAAPDASRATQAVLRSGGLAQRANPFDLDTPSLWPWGAAPLHVACRVLAADSVRALLEAGADPNARDNDGLDRYGIPEHGQACPHLPHA